MTDGHCRKTEQYVPMQSSKRIIGLSRTSIIPAQMPIHLLIHLVQCSQSVFRGLFFTKYSYIFCEKEKFSAQLILRNTEIIQVNGFFTAAFF